MPPRCSCGYFHAALGQEACTQGIPVHRDTGPSLLLYPVLPRLEHKVPHQSASGKPVQWSRARCVEAGARWVQAHPGLPLQTTHLKARYGLPSPDIIRQCFGHISTYREALGLPTGRVMRPYLRRARKDA